MKKYYILIVKYFIVLFLISILFLLGVKPIMLYADTDYDNAFRIENMISDDTALDISINSRTISFRDVFGDSIYGSGKTNLVENGDFSLDVDSNNSPDSWGVYTPSDFSYSYLDNVLDFEFPVGSSYGSIYQFLDLIENHIYYFSVYMPIYDYSYSTPFVIHYDWTDYALSTNFSNSGYSSYISTCPSSHLYRLLTYIGLTDFAGHLSFDYFMGYDLTSLFGSGNEPSQIDMDNWLDFANYFNQISNAFSDDFYYISNFDTYYFSSSDYIVINMTESFGNDIPSLSQFQSEYLTQCDSDFDVCQNYEDVSDVEYGNNFINDILINDLDFDTSVLGYFGSNVDINFWGVLENDYSFGAFGPILNVSYLGKMYSYVATQEGNKFYFNLSDTEKIRIKRILFDRRSNDYITFVFNPELGTNMANFYFQIDNNFTLNASINTFYIGTYQNTYPRYIPSSWNYDLRNHKDDAQGPYSGFIDIRMYDNEGLRQTYTRLDYSNNIDNSFNIESRYYTFPNKFTNVQRFTLSFNPTSGNINNYAFFLQIYEIGIFSDSDIVNPSFNNNNLNDKYIIPTYQTVEWYDFFGHAKNTFNYILYDNSVSYVIQDLINQVVVSFTIFKTSYDLISGIAIIGIVLGISFGWLIIRKL